jgi:hypothetical protein
MSNKSEKESKSKIKKKEPERIPSEQTDRRSEVNDQLQI